MATSREKQEVVIRLTPDEARAVFLNADGWLDAGAGPGGLEETERAALHKLCKQIIKQIKLSSREGTSA